MLVIVAPGQGAQTPGFLAPWLEIDAFAEGLARLSEVTGLDLARRGPGAGGAAVGGPAGGAPRGAPPTQVVRARPPPRCRSSI